MNDDELTPLIQRHAERHAASARLHAAVQTQITLHAVSQRHAPPVTGRLRDWLRRLEGFLPPWGQANGADAGGAVAAPGDAGGRRTHTQPVLVGFVAGVLLTGMAVFMVTHWRMAGVASDALSAELLGLHVHALRADALYDVASSDRHTVKPWYQGKLDYAPQVPDLSDAGYVLLGGRLEKLQGNNTAVLAYQVRKHQISAYVQPAEGVVALTHWQQRGFSMAHWSDGAMQVWAVSDVDPSELDRFGAAWRSHTTSAVPAQP